MTGGAATADLVAEAGAARGRGDGRALVRLGNELERRLAVPEAWRCLADGAALLALEKGRVQGPEWDGRTGPGTRVTVLRLLRDIGAQLRGVRALDLLADTGTEVTLCAEPRLAPLVARSFPRLRVIPDEAQPAGAGPWTSYERVAERVWPSAERAAASFRPLRPDPGRVAALRRGYLGRGPGPLVGLSWWSSNTRKDLPPHAAWAPLLAGLDATFVSLQYAPREAGFAAFAAAAPVPVLAGDAVDPVADIDGCAAQTAAMDLVVSVSNTTVHMAGALGVPCLTPVNVAGVPERERWFFYPEARFFYKAEASWEALFARIAARARRRLPRRPGAGAAIGAAS